MFPSFQQDPAGQTSTHDVTLNVFMEGTANPMEAITTQIALFAKLCNAIPLPDDGFHQPDKSGHYKVCFAGCGVTNGITGTIFAAGLKDQCKVVRSYLETFLRAGFTVKINFVGLSRGGIGGVYLAQELADFDPAKVVLNMLLFDPVPGNFVWMAKYCDWFGQMNANKSMDLSSCRILGRVLVLYPHEPLPDIAVHAPVLCKFPEGCQVEQDVILGCHQGALFLRRNPDTCLSFVLIRDFLLERGSQLEERRGFTQDLGVTEQQLLSMLNEEVCHNSPTTRITHGVVPGTLIVRHSHGIYLNRYHEALLKKLNQDRPGTSGPRYMLDISTPGQSQ